ncbi:Cytochrome c-type biogenesis protein DsbD, protein-disulfide reductase [Marinobacter nauticus]|jgi:thiol:disulfide interchange protein DsbD|uniref:Thiol:disulfide interchange protein DsbD n=2 Tax=Marinobacter nauticus TaxID=2743 RepID=A0A833NDE3_MARNT|nr:Cytochrome c-type biogenesis protein DsbD, protein-disulfide reductase [Marinobacter nauticus]
MANAQSLAEGGNEFLPVDEAFQYDVQEHSDDSIRISWRIAPDYYLYRKRIEVQGQNGELEEVIYPAGVTISDKFFGESEVYYDSADLIIRPGNAEVLKLSWQGCAEAGLCYPPQNATINLTDNASTLPEGPASPASDGLAADQSLAGQLADSGFLWNLLVFFGLGLLLVFTPCVLPMIPILSSVIVGSGARRTRAFWLSLSFVLAMAVTYSALGVVAALAGANLQGMLQQPLFIGPMAVIFVVLALSMFGLYELQLPAPIRDRLERANSRQTGGSLAGAAVMGFFSALLASPCMTAPLAGALLYIADSGDAALGGMALLALGLGMGAPLLILATLGSSVLPRPGVWMAAIRAVFGVILLGTAIWFLDRILDNSLVLALWGALAIGTGLSLWRAGGTIKMKGLRNLLSSSGMVVILWGALMVIGAAAGGHQMLYPLEKLTRSEVVMTAGMETSEQSFEDFKSWPDLQRNLAAAGERGQWTLVDFYADWCISCKVIEEEVFGDPRVQQAFGDMTLLRADVTKNDEVDQELMRRLQVLGPPTVMIFGPDGQEYRAQRTIGEISAEAFLKRLDTARSS